ncbi:MAG: sulfite exporter TauE/SafE family protein [Verrucomicrobia bacterium]|nr:sulfite exporter TauE/SafE family protein [Verrucomicrobiota bacterium]
MDSHSLLTIACAVTATILIGVAKAGFGGGLGMLVTPLAALAFPPREALGIVLPLLIAGDAFSLYHYWRKWDARNVGWLLPGALAGIGGGLALIGLLDDHRLRQFIGGVSVSFIGIQWLRDALGKHPEHYHPKHWHGALFGLAAGVTTTLAHAAGPVVAMFLIPQRLPKEIFVGTTVLVFALINWIKMPFFLWQGLCTPETMLRSLWLVPVVPLGVWIGVWCNRRLSEKWFMRVVYVMVFATGLELLFG